MSTTSIRRPPEPGFGSRSASLLSERYNPHILPPLLGTVDPTSLFLFCLVGDPASMHPAHFLAGLQEAITASLQLSAVR